MRLYNNYIREEGEIKIKHVLRFKSKIKEKSTILY